jgi:hypothetical protein
MLDAMTTALIVRGVILFLALDAYVIARVFRQPTTTRRLRFRARPP